MLLTSLAARSGAGLAVLLSAVAFGLVHFDPVRPLFALVLGLALGLLRVRTDSLRPSVVVHACFNGLTFLVAPLVDDPKQPYTPQPALGLACLVLGAALAWPLLRAVAPKPAPTRPDCPFSGPCYPRRMRNSAVAAAVIALLGASPAPAAGAGGRGPRRPRRPGRPAGRRLPRGRGDRRLPRGRGAPRRGAGAALGRGARGAPLPLRKPLPRDPGARPRRSRGGRALRAHARGGLRRAERCRAPQPGGHLQARRPLLLASSGTSPR